VGAVSQVIARPDPGARQYSDSELIMRSRTEPEAFADLFDRHWTILFNYVVARLGPDAAEDLTGEAFLIAFEQRHTFDPVYESARPWLFGIVTKLIFRHRRAEGARYRAIRRSPRDTVTDGPADRVAAIVSATAARPLLAGALAKLATGERDVLLLIAWADLSYEETATALGIPTGTVRSRLNRARRKVRAALGQTNPLHDEEEAAL
jgi:RNA polymerase sigma factor (sigma-70 family)